MRIRFQADADLKHAIVAGVLRGAAAIDFQHAAAVPLKGLDDNAVLLHAAREGRVLVSHDLNTMEAHFWQFIREHRSPGLVLIPQRRITVGQSVESLVLIWEILEPEDLENRVCLVPSLVVYGF